MRRGLTFIVSIALARLLTPEEFGTIALLYLFTGVASAFVDSGFSAALIQRQETTLIDESTVFWFNIGMGGLVGLALVLIAPLIADFYQLPILVLLTNVLALNIFFSAMGAIHGTMLTKCLDFRTQMKIGAWSTVASGMIAVLSAWLGLGVWALAAQTLTATIVSTLLYWLLHPWRPIMVFSLNSARQLFGFGGYMLAAGLLDVGYSRLHTLLIGRLYGVRELGLYSRADGTQQLPVGILTGILARVAFPIFSARAQDHDRLRHGTRMAVRGMMLINIPMMLGISIVAEPLILTLFGAQWLPSVPILQVLCLAGIFWPLHVINLNVLMAQGHSNLFFRLEVLKKLLSTGLLIIGSTYGVIGIAWSQVASSLMCFGINSYYTGKHLKYGPLSQSRDYAPTLLASLPMVAAMHWLGTQLTMPPILQLLTIMTTGVFLFILIAWIGRISAFRDALMLISRRHLTVSNHEVSY